MKTQILLILALFGLCFGLKAQSYNSLHIPDTLSGTSFNLTLKDTLKQFKTGNQTITAGINGDYWGPTLFFNKGDTVRMTVKNKLNDSTTLHWHGMHLPAVMDGGPHQIIPPGTVWNPYWKVKNDAATYWYHPHLHEMTQKHISLGLGGFIIVRDSAERALNLPRTYGVDDIPLAIASRRFSTSNQIAYTTNDNYGDYVVVNGTLSPQASLPAQYVRLRLLNCDIARAYTFGFSDNRSFAVIANDEGLLDAPVTTTRVRMAIGERLEILVNLSADAVGSSLSLTCYNANMAFGYPGAEPNQSGLNGSLLNNKDFEVLKIKVTARTANPVLTLPATLVTNTYWTNADVTHTRTINVTGGTPGGPGQAGANFTLNNLSFSLPYINETVTLNQIEKWDVVNNQVFGHAFHIHDVKFKIISRTSTIQPYEQGWKDVMYLPKGETASFIAKFDDFSDAIHPYMYHCHFSTHEDEGMMGQFVVTAQVGVAKPYSRPDNYFSLYPNPANNRLKIALSNPNSVVYYLTITTASGRTVLMSPTPEISNGLDISNLPAGVYLVKLWDNETKATYIQRFVKSASN